MSSKDNVQGSEKCDKCKKTMHEEEYVDIVLKSGEALLVCGWCCDSWKSKDILQVYR